MLSREVHVSEAVTITVKRNGPLRVEGGIKLIDADGAEWDLTGKPAVSLCRCGVSEKRPFCDGSHNKIGWQCNASPGNLTGGESAASNVMAPVSGNLTGQSAPAGSSETAVPVAGPLSEK